MNEVFVLELPLQVEKYQADVLNKRYEQLRQLYNYVQGKLLRQFRYFEQMKEFRACKTFKEKEDFFRTHPFQINETLKGEVPEKYKKTEGRITKTSSKSKSDDIVILHTNDVHCGVQDAIGYDGLMLYKKQLLSKYNHVILVDAGDHIQVYS